MMTTEHELRAWGPLTMVLMQPLWPLRSCLDYSSGLPASVLIVCSPHTGQRAL